jgi:hypothetical protein
MRIAKLALKSFPYGQAVSLLLKRGRSKGKLGIKSSKEKRGR